MLLLGVGKNQDVVEIDENLPVEHVAEYVIDQGLEDSRRIGEAEWHDQILVVACRGVEGGLPLISLPDADEVVGVAQVQLGEDCSILEQLEGRGDEWQRVPILDGDVIQAPVVNAGSQRLIFLLDKEEPCAGWR